MSGSRTSNRIFGPRPMILAILLAWSATIGGLAWWYEVDHTENLSEMAHIYVRACHEKDLIYRQWNAAHGDVCPTASRPNPSLRAAERDVNRAKMAFQEQEPAANQANVHAHITSLKPLDVEDDPDTWEKEALLGFEKGAKEANLILSEDGKHTARLMRPIYVEQSCLKCHKEQGYKIGDVRGGISVTVPVDSIWQAGAQQARNVFGVFAGIWTLGAVTIVLVGKSRSQRRLEQEKNLEALARKQEFLNAVLDNISDGIVACDADGVLTLFNPATRQFHGLPAMPIPAEQWPQHFDLYQPDGITLMRMEEVPLYRALQGETVRNSEMVIAPKCGAPDACSRTGGN